MPIPNRSVAWKHGRLWLPIRSWAGFDNSGSADITLSQGTPTLEPLTTIEIAGLPMTTADEIHTVIPVPWDMDRTKKVFGRIYFFHYSTDADTPGFKLGTLFFARQAAAAEIKGGVDVDTAFASHTCSTTNMSLEVTKWTDLSWDSYITDTDMLVGLALELDALGSASADECKVIGVELLYTLQLVNDGGRRDISDYVSVATDAI